VTVAEPPTRLVYQVVPLPLRDYGLDPGDEIKLFARVEDNDRSSGESPGKGAESSVVLIRIISQQEFDQYRQTRDGMETLMAKYQQANRRLESLADDIEKLQQELRETKPGEQPSPELREKLKELSEKMAAEAEALRKLAKDKQPFEIDEELSRELEELADEIEQLQKKLQELADDDQAGRDEIEKRLAELANALREQREKLDEEAMQPLEKLAAVLPLSRDEQKFVQIYLRQRELADRLASLKDRDRADDPALKARMRDLEDEQRKIRTDLDALLSDIEEHLAGLPEDEEFNELRDSAREFVDALRESGAAEAMLEAENGLAEFSGTRGHASALEAADILEQFLQKAGQMGQEGAGKALGGFRPSLGSAMGKTLQQMLNRGRGRKSMGQGGGDGYSAARNTSDNVGLYGSDQNYSESQSGGEGMRQRENRSGRGPRSPGRALGGSGDGPLEAPGHLRASGGSDAAIPLRYRRQVGRYFQRVADELGDSGK
jgi:polyhydroxyalkanoate synthesis regulator protein